MNLRKNYDHTKTKPASKTEFTIMDEVNMQMYVEHLARAHNAEAMQDILNTIQRDHPEYLRNYEPKEKLQTN